jgi:hypothetical protein
MGALDAEMAALAVELLDELGSPGTYVSVAAGAFDPVTSEQAQTETEIGPINMAPPELAVAAGGESGEWLVAGTSLGNVTPRPGDRIEWNGKSYRVTQARALLDATSVAVWALQAERAT